MIVSFSGPHGDFSTRAEEVLLFRDNVQHYLQRGAPSPGYPSIQAMADVVALGPNAALLNAKLLWDEVSRAFAAIQRIESRDLAISLRTRAILTNTRTLPSVRGTVLVRLSGWSVSLATFHVATLGDLFRRLVLRLELATDAGKGTRCIEVRPMEG